MRRGVGVSAVKQRAKANKAYEAVGQAAAAENLAHVEALMTTFKASLEDFARKHKKDINQDPAFRQQFQTMCTNIG
jgi:ESCRT-II complex subunit VPS22